MEEREKEFSLGKVTFPTEKCGGCRTCELACSFHYTKLFQPSMSSIQIRNSPKPTVTFYRETAEGHIACDHCKGLSVPLCIEFCPSSSREELEKLFKAHMSAPRDSADQA